MRAVITRPLDDAERSASALRQRGVEVVLEPLLLVAPLPLPPQAEGDLVQARGWLLTSANGVRALARALRVLIERGILAESAGVWNRVALCVGDQTARTARAEGFRAVHSAQGDVHSLAALVRTLCDPAEGPLFHAAASVRAGDLAALLAADGFDIRRAALYETVPAPTFSIDFCSAVQAGGIDAVLLYSPRTAGTFATLARSAKLEPYLQAVTAYCLSPAVADALTDLSLSLVRVAAQPTQEALLSLIDQDRASLTTGDSP